MPCPSCGFENEGNAKFCGKCGAALVAKPAPHGGGVQGVTDGMNIGVIVATLFIPLLGIIMGAVFMNDADPGKKVAGKRWLLVGIWVFVAYCVLAMLCAVIGEGWNY